MGQNSTEVDTFIHRGRIEGGKLVLDNANYFRGMIGMYEDTKVRVIVERLKGNKTNAQLRYLYGVVYQLISEHTGYSVSELDKVMKAKFLKGTLRWRGGEIAVVQDKRDLKSDEMGEFIEAVRQEGAELGVVIPDADKNWDLEETTSMEVT